MMLKNCKINKLMFIFNHHHHYHQTNSITLFFKRWMRKGRMPSKHGKKDYMKGTGGGSMGQFINGIKFHIH